MPVVHTEGIFLKNGESDPFLRKRDISGQAYVACGGGLIFGMSVETSGTVVVGSAIFKNFKKSQKKMHRSS